VEECLLCGDETPVCECAAALPICEDCAIYLLPGAIAHTLLAHDDSGCSYGRIKQALTQVELHFWEEAAYHLHHDHDSDDDDDSGDDGHDGHDPDPFDHGHDEPATYQSPV